MEGELTPKQAAFVREYLIDLNGSAAARRAGYSERTAKQTAFELLDKPSIQAAIRAAMDERARRTDISADRVLQELARLAFFDIRKLYDDEGNPIPLSQLPDDVARAVVGIDRVAIGNENVGVGEVLKMRLADKKGALELLGKHLGLFSDRLRIEGELKHTNRVIKVPLKELAPAQQAAVKAAAVAVAVPAKDAGGWRPA